MNNEPDWPQIRRDYFGGEISLRDLAKKHGVSRRTLERRSIREEWRQRIKDLGGAVVASSVEAAREQGAELGLSVAKLVERSLRGAALFLNKIEAELGKPTPDPSSLRALVAAWRDTISVARLTHRMDEPQSERPLIKIGALSVAFVAAKERAIPVTIAATTATTKPNHHEPEPIDISPSTADHTPAASDNSSPSA